MKKVLFLLLVFVSVNSSAQFFKSKLRSSESLVVQKIDTVKFSETEIINNQLTSFYKANRASQILIIGGSAIAIAGELLYKKKSNDDTNIFPIIGGVCGFLGGVIYLDSFRFLNMNKGKKSKAKKISTDFNL